MRSLLATIICLCLFAVVAQAEPVIQFYYSKMRCDSGKFYSYTPPSEYGDGTMLVANQGEDIYLWAATQYTSSAWVGIAIEFTGDVTSGSMHDVVPGMPGGWVYRWGNGSDFDPTDEDINLIDDSTATSGIGNFYDSYSIPDGAYPYGTMHYCLGPMAWGTPGYKWMSNDIGLTLRDGYATSELYFGFNPDGTPEYAGPGEVAHTTSVRPDIFIGTVLPLDGDLNCDGDINSLDIDPFTLVLTEGCTAYSLEYPDCYCMLADVNDDGSINALDIDPFVGLLMQYNDCNGNGVSDDFDIAHGTSADLDGNGLPDECQQQLYVNRVPSEYATIQSAINHAPDGFEVLVADGVYTGSGNKNLDFGGKTITIKSENGPYNCTIDCEDSGRGFYFHSGETAAAVVDGFTIRNGYISVLTSNRGGGIYCDGGSPTITNCILTENRSTGPGGAINIRNSSAPTVANCLLVGNESTGSHGGGLFSNESSTPTIANCTFADNVADDMAGGLFGGGSGTTVELSNCIFWGNSAPNGNQLAAGNSGVLNISYCDVAGGSAGIYLNDGSFNWLAGNIEDDPLFVDPASGDYHLLIGSPCIDAGDPGGDYTGQTDIDGDPRVLNGRVDMGADEFPTVLSDVSK